MVKFVTIERLEGKVSFLGMVRTGIYGTNEFCIEFDGRPPMYGEWRAVFTEDSTEISVEVLSFGFLNEYVVSQENASARCALTEHEALAAKRLILEIFTDDESRNSIYPFTVFAKKYNGKISFDSEWIILRKN